MIDVVTALRDFLLSDADVYALVGDRIYGDEVGEVENMPQKCIVIIETGGQPINSFLPINKPKLDLYCYGETYVEAAIVDKAVAYALKYLDRKTIYKSLLHGAEIVTGAWSLRDPDTGWRMKMRSITVSIDEREVS